MEENTIVPLVAVHIKQLYSEALLEFPQNTRFWDEYIKFLQQFKFHRDISEAFDRMLEVCPRINSNYPKKTKGKAKMLFLPI